MGEAWKVRFNKIEALLLQVAQDAKKFCFCGLPARFAHALPHAHSPAAPSASGTQGNSMMKEISVMNNYFGIGLDAKISLDFNNMREENPAAFRHSHWFALLPVTVCRSRVKNQMWYGLLGSREMLFNSCKNLQQRIRLKCDGFEIELPRLQGVVVLNINSYMGGTNFVCRAPFGSPVLTHSLQWGTKVLPLCAAWHASHPRHAERGQVPAASV